MQQTQGIGRKYGGMCCWMLLGRTKCERNASAFCLLMKLSRPNWMHCARGRGVTMSMSRGADYATCRGRLRFRSGVKFNTVG